MSNDTLIDAIAALPLGRPRQLPVLPLDEASWGGLLDDVIRQRLTPALAAAIASGAFPATAAQREATTNAHCSSMQTCVQLERVLLEVVELFERESIPYRVLKGAAVAHLDYADPAQRSFGDVDVLVAAERYDDAISVLTSAGARRRYPEVRAGFDRRYGKGACLVRDDGFQVDVHRSLAAGPFGITIDCDDLFASPVSFELAGQKILAPSREGRFLHACMHALLGDQVPRPAALRDVAMLSLAPTLDVSAVIRIASHWRADAVVAAAIRTATDRLGLVPGVFEPWARAHVADRFQARAMRAYAGAGRSYAAQAAAGLAAVPGVGGKLAYGRALLLATPAYVSHHDGGYRHGIRRAWDASRVTWGTRP